MKRKSSLLRQRLASDFHEDVEDVVDVHHRTEVPFFVINWQAARVVLRKIVCYWPSVTRCEVFADTEADGETRRVGKLRDAFQLDPAVALRFLEARTTSALVFRHRVEDYSERLHTATRDVDVELGRDDLLVFGSQLFCVRCPSDCARITFLKIARRRNNIDIALHL